LLNYLEFLRVDGWVSDYRSVQNLLLHLARKSKSEGTKKIYLWYLFKFALFMRKTPAELVRMKRGDVEKGIQEYADSLAANSSRAYANTAIGALKSFFAANGFRRNKALEIQGYYRPPRDRITHEYIPTKTGVCRMADSAGSLRDRAMMLMFYSSGLRNSTLRALRIKDFKDELLAGNDIVLVQIYPGMKEVDPGACKGNIPYYTFLCEEGTQALRLYLEDRKERFGGVNDNEPVFCTEHNQVSREERRKRPLTSREAELIVKSAAKKAGIRQWVLVHPHCLRKSYETVLRSQLIDGRNLDVKTQEFLMGHVLPRRQDNYYDSSKVESMRILYSNLKFGRTVIENRFRLLRATVARAFEGSDIDPDELIAEYAATRLNSKHPS